MEILKLFATIAINSEEAVKGLEEVEERAEQTGQSLSERLGGLGGAIRTGLVAGVTAAGAAAVGIGAAAFKIGESFDEAFDTIRAGTGATGETLAQLQDDFRAVAARVPVDFAQVGTAVADLNTRLGVSGPVLQELATQFLNLSRVTGQDVAPLIAEGSRMFNIWGISAEQAGGKLDYLWRVSQATGIGMGELFMLLTRNAPVLQEAGFDFETAAAMLGQFEKAGIDSSRALMGLSQMIAKAAQEGTPARDVIAEVFDQIKNAKDPTEATALAVEWFGARAGTQLAAAIRSGQLDLETFVQTLKTSGDTINGLASETDDFAQKWQLFKNQLMLAAEPLANTVFGLAGTILDVLAPAFTSLISAVTPLAQAFFGWIDSTLQNTVLPALERFSAWFAEKALPAIQGFVAQAGPPIQNVLREVASFVTGQALPALERLATWFTGTALPAIQSFLASAWSPLQSALSAVGTVIGAVVAALAPLLPLFQSLWQSLSSQLGPAIGQIASAFQSVWSTIQSQLLPAIQALLPVIGAVAAALGGAIVAAIGVVIGVISGLANAFAAVLPAAIQVASGIIQAFAGVINLVVTVVSNVVRIVVALLTGDWRGAWEARSLFNALVGGSIVPDLVNRILSLFTELKEKVIGFVTALRDTVVNLVTGLKDGAVRIITELKSTWESIWGAIRSKVDEIWGAIKSTVTEAITSVRTTIQNVMDEAKRIWDSIWNGIREKVAGAKTEVIGIVTGLVSDVKGAFSGAVTWLVDAGRNVIQGLINGISSKLGELLSLAQSIADRVKSTIKNALNIGSPSRVMIGFGQEVARGLALGMDRARELVTASAQNLAASLVTPIELAVSPAPALHGETGRAMLARQAPAIATAPHALVVVERMEVRSEEDIARISQELYRLITPRLRAQGTGWRW
jgi:TP901 family phage tail tape measure protein